MEGRAAAVDDISLLIPYVWLQMACRFLLILPALNDMVDL